MVERKIARREGILRKCNKKEEYLLLEKEDQRKISKYEKNNQIIPKMMNKRNNVKNCKAHFKTGYFLSSELSIMGKGRFCI